MKKNLLCLVLLLALVFVPFGVLADDVENKNTTTTEDKTATTAENTNTTTKKEIGGDLVLTPKESAAGTGQSKDISLKTSDANAEFKTVKIKVTGGSAIANLACKGSDDFTVTASDEEDGALFCTFTVPNDGSKKGSELKLGKLTFDNNIKDDEGDEACLITASLVDVKGNVNANTGVELPYVLLISGVALAGALYFATNKKTKLQKI